MINGEFSSAYHYCLIDTVYTFKCCCDITQVLKRATEYQVTRLFLLWVIRFWVYNNTWNNIVVTIVGASFNEGRDRSTLKRAADLQNILTECTTYIRLNWIYLVRGTKQIPKRLLIKLIDCADDQPFNIRPRPRYFYIMLWQI
jgi:hypothetical protein